MSKHKTVLPLQTSSMDTWETKYQLKNKEGVKIDLTVVDTFKRVAKALASVEKDQVHWEEQFLWALSNGAIPAGRSLSNLGAEEHKPGASSINCTVSDTIEDSIEGILGSVRDAGITLSAGCGIGYEFSTIRPNGAMVSGVGATTTGAIPFMDIFDKMCFTIASAGGRRGAQMATFDLEHPDVLNVIKAKREDGKLRQFNISLLITEKFLEAVKNNTEWVFSFPVTRKTFDANEKYIYRKFPGDLTNYLKNKEGEVACKIYGSMPAVELWDIIMQSTYTFSEPGFLLIDKINKENPLYFCEDIRATNPCAEQPLPPNGACLLGSINLTHFVSSPFTDVATFDFAKFSTVVSIFTRMLDNVVDMNNLPLESQRNEILRKRRHGMGYLGLGSAMTMLGMVYGSPESVALTDKITKTLAIEGWRTGIALAKEKGAAPIFAEDFKDTDGTAISCAILFIRSVHIQRILKEAPELHLDFIRHGCRFTHHSSIAPTGTLALSVGNNASNGIEPSFAHSYMRNVIKTGKSTKQVFEVASYELLLYRHLFEPAAHPSNPGTLPDYFKGADEIDPKRHIDIQAAAQYWIDSSISKTINVPTDMPYEDFKDIYSYAIDKGLKGCTTFRFNPEVFQGVLVKEEDLKNTQYTFVLESGEEVTVAGDATIDYEGDSHSAANLFDAIKEGYYGKF
jgi:ribonucleoside-diphosphate reductase alpha chain